MKPILLLVAGIVSVVIVIAGIVLYLNRDTIANFAMDRALKSVESRVLASVPSGVTPDSARAEFAALHELLQQGTVRAEDIKDLAAMYYTSVKDDRLDSTEVHELIVRVHTLTAAHRTR
jgi:hypothetical protein